MEANDRSNFFLPTARGTCDAIARDKAVFNTRQKSWMIWVDIRPVGRARLINFINRDRPFCCGSQCHGIIPIGIETKNTYRVSISL